MAVARLERPQAADRVAAQHARAIGRARGGGVQRRHDVLPGRPALQLHDHVVRDFLRRDEFHLSQRRDGFELVAGEQSILADVDVHAGEWPAEVAPRLCAGRKRLLQRDRRFAIYERDRLPFPAHRSMRHFAPRDRRRRLDLHRHRRVRRASQQEQQHRMRAGDRRLREQRGTGPLLRVRVRNIESHSARAARPDLHVGLRAGAPQRFGDDLRVTDQLRQRQTQQMLLDRRAIDPTVLRARKHRTRALKNVLIRKRSRGIDAIHDCVGFVAQQQAKQEVALQHAVAEIAQQIAEHQRAVLGVAHDRGDVESRDGRRHEHVAPFDIDRHPAAVGLESARGGPHFILEQRDEHEAARRWRRRQNPARHRVADQATSAQQHYRPVSELHVVARSLRSPAG